MRSWLGMLPLFVAAACTPPSRQTDPDAATGADADAYVGEWFPEPFQLTGYTPAGSVEDLSYIRAAYLGAWCGYAYRVQILENPDVGFYATGRYLVLTFEFDEGASASATNLSVTASMRDDNQELAATNAVLEADRVDSPIASEPHIIGRFVTSEPGWSLDFRVDVVSQFRYSCF